MGRSQEKSSFKIVGMLEERRGYLHIQLSAGTDENGKRNRKSVATGLKEKGNKRNAKDLMDNLIEKLESTNQRTGILNLSKLLDISENGEALNDPPKLPDQCNPTASKADYPFSQMVKDFLRYVKTRVDENTHQKYTYASNHIIPYFDAINATINTVMPKDVIDYYSDMMDIDLNAENGTTALGAQTLSTHSTVLQGTMKYAKEVIKIIEWNKIADVPAPRKQRRIPSFYNRLQINEVLRKIQGHVLEPVVVLTATYGLRRQEVLGLKWNAFDFDDKANGKYGSFVICHTVTRVGNKVVCADKTKTASSVRTLPITKNIAKYLKRLYAHQKQMKVMCKTGYTDNDYVCVWDDGHQIRPDYVSCVWKELLEKFKMPHIRFHDLRHSCASLLINMKFSLKDVQEWLGHADIKSTEVYIHLYNSKENVAIEIDKVLIYDDNFDVDLDMDPLVEEMALTSEK